MASKYEPHFRSDHSQFYTLDFDSCCGAEISEYYIRGNVIFNMKLCRQIMFLFLLILLNFFFFFSSFINF